MTRADTEKVLAYITAAYPRYFSELRTVSAVQNMINAWTDVFTDYSVDVVMTGVKGYISADSSGFPPSPGQVVEYIHIVGNPADQSGTEAWALVRRAVNVPWDQFEASFATLPKTVQVAVGSPDSLKEMAKMDLQQFETVAQSNFLRMYDAARRREATENRFPNAVIGAKPRVMQELSDRTMQRNPGMIEQKREPERTQIPAKPQVDRQELSEDTENRLAELRRRFGR